MAAAEDDAGVLSFQPVPHLTVEKASPLRPQVRLGRDKQAGGRRHKYGAAGGGID